jgi:glucan phosphoethanolaminetransferase (alkaline phosphatase superfamily)
MEVFGFTLNELIFSIFLPLILFYLIILIFLKRSNIFGEIGNTYYSLTALTISLISILSLHSLGLTKILPYLAAALTVLSFVAVYLYGVFKYSINVATREERFENLKKEIERLTSEYEKEKDEKKKEEIKKNIKEKLSEIENLAKQIGRKVEEEDWYKNAKGKVV